jgi:hypothetical protein
MVFIKIYILYNKVLSSSKVRGQHTVAAERTPMREAHCSRAGRGSPRMSWCTTSGARWPYRALSGAEAGGESVVMGGRRGGGSRVGGARCGASAAVSVPEAGGENVLVGGPAAGANGALAAAASVRCEQCEKRSSWPFAGRVSQASRRTWVLASTKACLGPGTLPARDPSRSL